MELLTQVQSRRINHSSPAKALAIINDYFKPRNFGMTCYIAVANWYTDFLTSLDWLPVLPSWPTFFFFFLDVYFFFISWRLITLQYCSGFCHTLTWVSHGYTCIPHPDPHILGHSLTTCASKTSWASWIEYLDLDSIYLRRPLFSSL